MEILTDEMITKDITAQVHLMLGVFIAVSIFFVLIFRVAFNHRKSAVMKAAAKGKTLTPNSRSLIVVITITGFVCLLLFVATLGPFKSEDDWRITYETVSEMKIEVETSSDQQTKTCHIIHIENYYDYILVGEDEYNNLSVGDKVYTLFVTDEPSRAWSIERWNYVGDRLEE